MPRSLATLVLAAALGAAILSCRGPAGEQAEVTLARPAADDDGDSAITLVAPAFERAASSLSHLFHVSGEVFGTIDPIDGEVLFLDKSGAQLGVSRLPDGFMVRDVDIRPKDIVLRGDRSAVVIPRKGAIPAALRAVALPPPMRVIREGRALRIERLTVHPQETGRVLAVSAIGQDRDGRHYLYWEEGGGRQVDAWVGRFGKDGKLAAAAKLDFSDFAEVPAVPVAVVPDGTLLLMEPAEESIRLLQLTLGKGLAAASAQVTGNPAVRVLDLGEDKAAPPPPPAFVPRGPVPEHSARFGTIAIQRATPYLEAHWVLRPANFLQPGIADECEPPEGKYWARPTRLSDAHVGKRVAAMPYKWGGFDSVEQFRQKLSAARPALAGDVCTCRDDRYNGCMVSQAAGIDCSGFVSRAWGLAEHKGTTQLLQIAGDLPDLFHLKPGDILNRPGSHVRLFIGFEPGPEVRLRTLESAVSCGGVCARVFTPVQLMSYRPMRFRR